MNSTPQSGKGFRGWYKRQSRIGRISFVLTAAIVLMLLLGRVSHLAEMLFIGPIILCFMVVSPLLIILLYRWLTQRFLWKVRNRLIITYALMSLAPVILCVTLFSIASYIFGGQFATNSVLTLLNEAATQVNDETASSASVSLASNGHTSQTPNAAAVANAPPISLAVVKAGVFVPLNGAGAELATSEITKTAPTKTAPTRTDLKKSGSAKTALATPDPTNPFIGQPVPSWVFPGFRGLVLSNGRLYVVAFMKFTQAGKTVTVLGSQPFNADALGNISEDLGRVILTPGFSLITNGKGDDKSDDDSSQKSDEHNFAKLDAGALPPPAHVIDPPVVFSAPTSVLSWQTGDDLRGLITVFSRPSVLYTRLFASTNGLGTFIRTLLVSIAIFFALLELFALLMAAGLSRTITRSVGELYRGTREIDRGNFDHRIVIKRKDQLGALANSFNSMTSSIVDLLAQQREKERLLSELSIAREVQANLFPHSPVTLPGFEIHAVCQPARTVSGDYFDFIFGRHGNELCLALGDISGKGISAALLMASLHSAVRAFGISNGDGKSNGSSNPSPALLLELLNKHIFASTPPEKYATLFLAYYNAGTRKLTYSNGGHLAPMVLSCDGMVKHLDRGGTPVGLFNGLKYEEETIELQTGDLLLAFSDGLTEPERNDEQFGEDRLLGYIREHCKEPLPVLAAATLMRLQEWIDNQEQPDDMTLLLARQL